MRRCALCDRVELQERASQELPDLVVQVAGDPDAFGLLGGQHAPTALLALSLEPVEHAVEGGKDAADLVAAVDGQALTRPQQIDGLHTLGQPLQGRHHPPQKKCVRDQCDHEPADDDQRLHGCDRRVDLDRTEQQQERDRAEQAGVDGEDAPEQ